MTEEQPGTIQTGAADAGNQDAGFSVSFDEGNTEQSGAADGNVDSAEGADINSGEGLNDTGATDAFAWVPEDYREEFRNDSTLNQFASQDAFIKAMLDDRRANGVAVRLPGENATEEDWEKFYDKLGRPESPEAYGLSKELPEGLEFSEDLYEGFTKEIYSSGLSKKQAEKIYTWYNQKSAELVKEMDARIQASYKKSVDDAVASLKKEWGTDYQKNLDSAVATANRFLSPATKQYLNATKLGNNPLLIKDFYNLSKQVSGAQIRGDGPSGNINSLAELEAKMEANLRAADYTKNVRLQQENKEIATKIAQLQSKG